MNKLAKKIAVYATIGTIGAISLTGCGEKSKNATGSAIEVDKDETKDSSVALDAIKDDVNKGDVREYEPYEHLFHVRYPVKLYIDGNSIKIPNGYEIYSINNVIQRAGAGSTNYGYDIWFTNKDKVRVKAIYNKEMEKYDFSNFGEVIETKEKGDSKVFQKNDKN